MSDTSISLKQILEGWDGYQASLVHAIAPLTREQLAWRPAPQMRSVGETAGHLAIGRIGWFARMDAPLSRALEQEAAAIQHPGGNLNSELCADAALLVHWLDTTWAMIDATLLQWSVDDLFRTFRHAYWGTVYEVSYQWTIWRILSHDIQHGGQIAQMLGMQGIAVPELGDLGGHLTVPPVVKGQ